MAEAFDFQVHSNQPKSKQTSVSQWDNSVLRTVVSNVNDFYCNYVISRGFLVLALDIRCRVLIPGKQVCCCCAFVEEKSRFACNRQWMVFLVSRYYSIGPNDQFAQAWSKRNAVWTKRSRSKEEYILEIWKFSSDHELFESRQNTLRWSVALY